MMRLPWPSVAAIRVAQCYQGLLVPSKLPTAQWSVLCWELSSGIKLPVFTDYRSYRSVGGGGHFRSTALDHCASSFFPFSRVSTPVDKHSHTRRDKSADHHRTVPYRRRRSRFSSRLKLFTFFFFAMPFFVRLLLLRFNGAPLNYDDGLLYNYFSDSSIDSETDHFCVILPTK